MGWLESMIFSRKRQRMQAGRNNGVPDIAQAAKKEFQDRVENIIGDYARIARSVLKESHVHENMMATVRNFASHESNIVSTSESLKHMQSLTNELKFHVDQITARYSS
eukprot:TRINITY_DN2402_c0_g1_i1.p1 TRINITY_DN2402_c0_g1~~TRINITY_DN2402_c0_g1_i1.p1  ORF type:complete len:108 (-),score=15.02 TRINITY_DN2402_c0_g1_i1:209-532(-)